LLNGKLLLAVSCLLFFSTIGLSQQAAPPSPRDPVMQEFMKNQLKTGGRLFWDEQRTNSLAISLMMDSEIRTAWNISDEQYKTIQSPIPMEMLENPEYKKIQEEARLLSNADDPFGTNADRETRRKLMDLEAKMILLMENASVDAIDKILTPEQKRKIQEAHLASMSEIPITLPNAFEALDLSDAQRQQMDGIKKELEPEFETHLEQFVDRQMILENKFFAEVERRGGFASIIGEGMDGMDEAIRKKLLAEDPEYKRIQDAIQSQSQAFSEKFRTKMFDVLTDAQWARLQQLIDNPPEHAKVFRKKLREQQGKSEANEKSSVWIPGPGAWQPGSSAIPEQYRQERNSRFPRGGN